MAAIPGSAWSALVWFVSGGAATWAGLLIKTWRERKIPNFISVVEDGKVELLGRTGPFHDRVGITLDGDPIERLAMATWKVRNEGTELIENIELRFSLPRDSSSRIIETQSIIDPKMNREFRIVLCYDPEDEKSFDIKIPYLNSYKPHKSVVSVILVYEGSEKDRIKVEGGGPGWSIRHHPMHSRSDPRKFQLGAAFGLLAGSLIIASFPAVKWRYDMMLPLVIISILGISTIALLVVDSVYGPGGRD